MAVWIVSAGSSGRDYADAFYKFGMAFVGGGNQCSAMGRVQEGDIILLKRGVSEFLSAGIVVNRNGVVSGNGDKDWLRDFDGWDLPAYCHVEWHVSPQPVPAQGLRQGTIYKSSQPQHLAAAQALLAGPAAPPASEPGATEAIDDEKLLSYLIQIGLPVSSADELTEALRRIRLLAHYYYTNWDWAEIREHETRTFLVTPLLLALGWSEQQLKIELPAPGGRVDVACFAGPYSGKAEDVVALLETKGFSQGLFYAADQARGYATHFPRCKAVIITNGFCYKTFVRGDDGAFPASPSAYLNLLRPRSRYPLDPEHVGGALDALDCLLPAKLLRGG
ncbi:hypothetical protein [Thioalkalivibrio sulfidiphilus]|uniref:hypothetical protein n=1 Tax=Thioalkalivibrio sulfidiphilus TaxID=1033854 RepID=UPI0003788A18|nr:hypothetical protein [Thioalkalivibrio sulfidiphilus]